MHRNALKELIAWKESNDRKPLIVNGARQVGKTWLALNFGRAHFGSVAHVTFLDNVEMQSAFSGSLNPERLLTLIGAVTNTTPADGNTLVFLDEIQECPRAITSLKMFREQRPDIPIIAAGSLLGVALNRAQPGGGSASWPVGKVSYLDLHPLTFDEFVRATAGDQLANSIKSGDMELVSLLSERLSDLLKTYFFVGGMPEAVEKFIQTRDLTAVRTIQQELLSGYEFDFSKHVNSPLEAERIRQTWHSVPTQLARESDLKRFVYASIRDGARGRDYRDAVAWLVDSGLVTKVPRVNRPGIPLAGYEDDAYFKLYLVDVGLLGAAANLPASSIAQGNRMFTEYKGAFAEQYVCQQLVASHICPPRYWSADGKQAKGEVDFLIEHEGSLFPIEVKADENVRGSSIAAFAKKYDVKRSVRFSMLPWKDQSWLANVPLYAVNSLPKLI